MTTIFSGAQRCNVGLMFQLFETMLQQCCNVALRLKSSLRIVPWNITFSLLLHVQRSCEISAGYNGGFQLCTDATRRGRRFVGLALASDCSQC